MITHIVKVTIGIGQNLGEHVEPRMQETVEEGEEADKPGEDWGEE